MPHTNWNTLPYPLRERLYYIRKACHCVAVFSGLGQVSKVDPEQKKKEEVRQWLTSSLDNLNRQIDEFESEIESIYAGSKKKKLDRDVSAMEVGVGVTSNVPAFSFVCAQKNDRVEELQGWVERHKYHIKELEVSFLQCYMYL